MREVELLYIAWRKESSLEGGLGVIIAGNDEMYKARCVELECKRQRRVMVKLRGGTAEVSIETGRWCGLSRDERICKNCDINREVEDVDHCILQCVFVAEERLRLMNEIVEGWQAEDEG